jgi:hypothetical protein
MKLFKNCYNLVQIGVFSMIAGAIVIGVFIGLSDTSVIESSFTKMPKISKKGKMYLKKILWKQLFLITPFR